MVQLFSCFYFLLKFYKLIFIPMQAAEIFFSSLLLMYFLYFLYTDVDNYFYSKVNYSPKLVQVSPII